VGEGRGVEKPKKRGRGRPKGARRGATKLSRKDQANIITQHASGVRQYELAAMYGVSDQAIHDLIQLYAPLFDGLDKVEDYRRIQTELLDATGYKVLKSMNETSKLDSANIAELSRAYDVINKNSRLTKGLSTANVSEKRESIVRILPPITEER
jgi:transposase